MLTARGGPTSSSEVSRSRLPRGKDLTAGCEFEAFPRMVLSVGMLWGRLGWGVWVRLVGLMVTDHVEFGPLAEEVPLLLLSGPSSLVWKNMTCLLNHWSYVCVCVCVENLDRVLGSALCVFVVIYTKKDSSFITHIIKCNTFYSLEQSPCTRVSTNSASKVSYFETLLSVWAAELTNSPATLCPQTVFASISYGYGFHQFSQP